jgi:rubredoxin
MVKYKCSVCGCVYDPELGDPGSGIAPGTPFEKLPDGWVCPECLNLGVKVFRLIE